jgi:hypothetical protein
MKPRRENPYAEGYVSGRLTEYEETFAPYLADLECPSCGETTGHRSGCEHDWYLTTGRNDAH